MPDTVKTTLNFNVLFPKKSIMYTVVLINGGLQSFLPLGTIPFNAQTVSTQWNSLSFTTTTNAYPSNLFTRKLCPNPV